MRVHLDDELDATKWGSLEMFLAMIQLGLTGMQLSEKHTAEMFHKRPEVVSSPAYTTETLTVGDGIKYIYNAGTTWLDLERVTGITYDQTNTTYKA